MKFDAYGATIRGADSGAVASVLADAVEGIICRGKPVRRFGEVLNVDTGPRLAAWIGSDPASGAVYVEAKGETTPAIVSAIRSHFPAHSVPRVDVAEDYDSPGAFAALQRVIRAAKGARVKGGYVALPDDEKDGRTWAAGVRGGVGYVRLYEAGKHPDRVHLGRPDWVRAEAEIRPHYARDKAAASTMSPVDVWGLAGWTHRVGEALTQVEITRFEPEVRRYSHDKTTRYIALTFRRHLEEMLRNGEHIERTFRSVWEEADDYERRYRQKMH